MSQSGNNCRFCRKSITNENKLDIDNEVASLFGEVTGIRLDLNRNLSLVSCELCIKSLQFISAMKLQFITAQFEQTKQIERIKVESDEEVSDNEGIIEEKKCEQCHQTFSTNFALKMHRKKSCIANNLMEPHSVRCPYKNCRISLYSIASLREHKREFHGMHQSKETVARNGGRADTSKDCKLMVKGVVKKEFYCDECNRQFHAASNFTTHQIKEHAREPLITQTRKSHSFKCQHCDLSFSYSSNLTRHMERTHGFRRFHCNFPSCRKILFEIDEAISHINEVHHSYSRQQKDALIAKIKKNMSDNAFNNSIQGIKDDLVETPEVRRRNVENSNIMDFSDDDND